MLYNAKFLYLTSSENYLNPSKYFNFIRKRWLLLDALTGLKLIVSLEMAWHVLILFFHWIIHFFISFFLRHYSTPGRFTCHLFWIIWIYLSKPRGRSNSNSCRQFDIFCGLYWFINTLSQKWRKRLFLCWMFKFNMFLFSNSDFLCDQNDVSFFVFILNRILLSFSQYFSNL